MKQAKADRALPRKLTGHSKHPLSTKQEMTLHMGITRWSTEIRLIIFFAAKDGEALLQSVKTRLGADCGTDYELFIAKFRHKLKKVGKTTRPFGYDQNQMPNDYTVEVTNRFKGLDLIECMKNYGRRSMTLYRSQGSGPSRRKRNAKRQNGCLRRPYKEL